MRKLTPQEVIDHESKNHFLINTAEYTKKDKEFKVYLTTIGELIENNIHADGSYLNKIDRKYWDREVICKIRPWWEDEDPKNLSLSGHPSIKLNNEDEAHDIGRAVCDNGYDTYDESIEGCGCNPLHVTMQETMGDSYFSKVVTLPWFIFVVHED